MTHDPVTLTSELIKCDSVTPREGGAIELLKQQLSQAGFDCVRIDEGGISNLFARWGAKGHPKTFGFNGHTDVVPVGDVSDWSADPFGAEVRDGWMYGRGSTDMKSGVAAFVAAAIDLVSKTPPDGALIITITGDEEGDAIHGTRAILDWMRENDEKMSVCLVGEPTCPNVMGEMMKIGRRGSMTAFFEARGVQGHSAYPHRAKNPVSALAKLMDRLASTPLDAGTEHFDPSTLVVTTFDTGNPATNVIPASCKATANIRFNDLHSSQSLGSLLNKEVARIAEETGVEFDVRIKVSGESFLTPPGEFSDLIAAAVEAEVGTRPVASTSGGTSDARFVKEHCPVVEFGLVGQTMHQVDERVEVAHIISLKAIYKRIMRSWFQTT